MTVHIADFRPEHTARVGELNRAWLEGNGLMEHSDVEQLDEPGRYFIGRGGRIFVALDGDRVVGTCAIVPHGAGELELAKLAVDEACRGRGIARRLVDRCLDHARTEGVGRVILVSNSRLQAALRLYESLGFRYAPVPDGTPYAVADVCMILDLDVVTPVA